MRAVNTDLIAGLLGLGFTLLFFLARENWMPLSAAWPNTILGFLLIFSLALLGKAVLAPQHWEIFREGSRRRILVAVASLIAWGLGVHYLGFASASFVVFMFLWWYVGHAVAETEGTPEAAPSTVTAYLRAAVVTAAVIGVFYVIFTRMLYVPLPGGLLI